MKSSTAPSTEPHAVAQAVAEHGTLVSAYPWLPALVQNALEVQVSRSKATADSNAARAAAARAIKADWVDSRLRLLPLSRPDDELVPLVQNATRHYIRQGDSPIASVPGCRFIVERVLMMRKTSQY